jgi:hypothetical protein
MVRNVSFGLFLPDPDYDFGSAIEKLKDLSVNGINLPS